ncbi:MAG: nucleotide exchange factor GrpE [Bacteroidales bacterium]|nr:nucleotide exchange factor GrpE [Bacteroidales bacterium]
MVKKRSHEERHEESMPTNETDENQTTAETETSGRTTPPGDGESSVKHQAGEELPGKLTEMQDRYLRLSAEFDNYRKRTLREKIELSQSGGESVINKLLPIIDDFDRAMISMRATEDCNAVKAGLELIYVKINDFLRQNGVKEIEAVNEPFNSDLHEAVTSFTVEDEALKGKIIEVTQKGYTLNEKVIRFPKVVVGE